MIKKLPAWIEYGAFILAFTAGNINAVTLLCFEHQSTSHLSGTATQLGITLAENYNSKSVHLLLIITSFIAGATISGVLQTGKSLKLGRHYDLLLAIEAILLLSAMPLLRLHFLTGLYLLAAACGLQNALATTYSSAVVRTTHLTGIFTDLGIMLGSKLRGQPFDKRKAFLFCLIIIGFISGSSIGASLYDHCKYASLAVPSTTCFILAASYWYFNKKSFC